MNRGVHLVREQVKDLRVLRTGSAHHIDRTSVVVLSAMRFYIFEKHWFHLPWLRSSLSIATHWTFVLMPAAE